MSEKVFDAEKRQKWLAFVQSLNPDIDPGAIRLMEEMRGVGRTIYHIGERSVNAADLSFAKYRLLMALLFSEEIEGRNQLNPSEISERQGVSRNTVSSLIRHLEEDGLIERHLDAHDRRKFNIRLTEAGRARVNEHVRRHFRIIGECFSGLTGEEQQTLSRLLIKVSQNAEAALKRFNEEKEGFN